MIALRVSLNGQHLTTAGFQDGAMVTAMINICPRPPHDPPFSLELRIGGADAEKNLVEWLDKRPAVGDEITIRIVETNEADAPGRVEPLA
jgi:hypothetical protein